MDDAKQKIDYGVKAPLGKDKRENLVARATNILKNESDEEVLESIVELLEDLEMKAGLRERLKHFQENGQSWEFIPIPRSRSRHDFKLLDMDTAASTSALELEQAKPFGSRLDWKTHPINNELILRKIFEFSSVNDLKNIRLVSKKWRDLSLTSWRGKAVLNTVWLFWGVNYTEYTDTEIKEYITSGSRLEKLEEVPFLRYKIDSHFHRDYYTQTTPEKRKVVLEFFKSSVQHLLLVCTALDTLSILLTKLPELRVLRLAIDCHDLNREYMSVVSEGRECPFQNLKPGTSKLRKLELNLSSGYLQSNFPWKKIIQCAPALKSLCFKYRGVNAAYLEEQVIKSVCEVRMEENFSTLNLEELTIYSMSDDVISRIIESQFPLRSLYIVAENRNNASAISDLLRACGETLQYIELEIKSANEYGRLLYAPYLPSEVKLPKLKDLILGNGFVFPNLLCSLDAPNLENLIVEPNDPIGVEWMEKHHSELFRSPPLYSKTFRESCLLPNLNKFFYNENRKFRKWIFNAKELRILAKAMPNVTDLDIPLGFETLPIVYEVWPGLHSLRLVATELTYLLLDDYAITGFSVHNFSDDICVESREPNITNLRNLRKLVLETKLNGDRNQLRPRKAWITDFSGIYAFLQLPKLEILQLETICVFSPNVLLALKNRVPKVKLDEPNIFAPAAGPAYFDEDEYEDYYGVARTSEESSNAD